MAQGSGAGSRGRCGRAQKRAGSLRAGAGDLGPGVGRGGGQRRRAAPGPRRKRTLEVPGCQAPGLHHDREGSRDTERAPLVGEVKCGDRRAGGSGTGKAGLAGDAGQRGQRRQGSLGPAGCPATLARTPPPVCCRSQRAGSQPLTPSPRTCPQRPAGAIGVFTSTPAGPHRTRPTQASLVTRFVRVSEAAECPCLSSWRLPGHLPPQPCKAEVRGARSMAWTVVAAPVGLGPCHFLSMPTRSTSKWGHPQHDKCLSQAVPEVVSHGALHHPGLRNKKPSRRLSDGVFRLASARPRAAAPLPASQHHRSGWSARQGMQGRP